MKSPHTPFLKNIDRIRNKDLERREKHVIKGSDNFWVDMKGRVYHLDSKEPMCWSVCECVYNHTEYPYVTMSFNGTFRKVYMHRLMAEMFVPNPHHLPVVMHKNNLKYDFDISNLRWGTQSENVTQAYRDGLYSNHSIYKSAATIKSICEDLELGLRPIEICEKYSVSPQYVQGIKSRRLHKDISAPYHF